MERSLRGYNLAEIILAVGLAVVVVLALLGVGLSATRSNRKATDSVAGQLVADMVLENALHAAAKDSADPLWAANSGTAPLATGTVQVGATAFDYRTFARNVPVSADAGSSPPPGAPLLMKKVDVEVSWWNGDQAPREGYGNLKAYATRTIQVP
ncbi:hypothetical protein DYH09_09020 [bacterium CPR1]|nr:hypothetical protein [bacterium CPR1]